MPFLPLRSILDLQASANAEYLRKEPIVVTKETAKILEEAILKRMGEIYPEDKSENHALANVIAQISARTAVIAIAEYEKLNQED